MYYEALELSVTETGGWVISGAFLLNRQLWKFPRICVSRSKIEGLYWEPQIGNHKNIAGI